MTTALSAEDRAFFEQNGYTVVRNVVPQQNLDAILAAMEEYLGIDIDNPNDWYRGPVHPSGMVELYQHQALWDIRQSPRIHQAFSELWGTEKLWVSVDRVNLKAPQHPEHPEHDHKGFIHWDIDSSLPPSHFAQGVLCLTDTTAEMGGFQCVPELYRHWDKWLKTQPADRDPRKPELGNAQVVPVPANAGDLIIWNSMLAHGNGHNVSNRPRLAQYINMVVAPLSPLTPEQEANREDRVARWRDRRPPNYAWAHGDPEQWEQKHGKTAELTPLGRRLLGADLWE